MTAAVFEYQHRGGFFGKESRWAPLSPGRAPVAITGTSRATGLVFGADGVLDRRELAGLAKGEAGERRESTTDATIRLPSCAGGQRI